MKYSPVSWTDLKGINNRPASYRDCDSQGQHHQRVVRQVSASDKRIPLGLHMLSSRSVQFHPNYIQRQKRRTGNHKDEPKWGVRTNSYSPRPERDYEEVEHPLHEPGERSTSGTMKERGLHTCQGPLSLMTSRPSSSTWTSFLARANLWY